MISPEDISNNTFIEYNKAVMRMVGGKRHGIFHVSDLIQPKCGRNIYYSKRDPLKAFSGTSAKVFYAGQIVHAHTQLTTDELHEKPVIYSPFEDKIYPYEKTIAAHPDDDDFWYKVVIGTPDDIVLEKRGNEYYIADKKTKLTKPETHLLGKSYDSTKPEWKSQLSMYRLLVLKSKKIDCRFGSILSLDYADRLAKPKIHVFELEDPQKVQLYMIQRMTELTDHLKNRTLPARYVAESNRWMCNDYCPYYSLCFSGDDGVNI